MADKKILVSARKLTKTFKVKNGTVKAVGGVDLDIYKGETLALVVESGCGKSTLGRLLLRLIEPTSGEVIFDGKDITAMKTMEMRDFQRVRRRVYRGPDQSAGRGDRAGRLCGLLCGKPGICQWSHSGGVLCYGLCPGRL